MGMRARGIEKLVRGALERGRSHICRPNRVDGAGAPTLGVAEGRRLGFLRLFGPDVANCRMLWSVQGRRTGLDVIEVPPEDGMVAFN